MTYDAECRKRLLEICKEHQVQVDEEPVSGNHEHLEKQDFIIENQNKRIAESGFEFAQLIVPYLDMENKSIRVCMNAGYVKDRNEKSSTFGRKILTLLPNTKNNRSRVLKLNNNAYTALTKLKEIAVAKNSEFVVSGRNGNLVRPKSVSNSFTSICDIAGIKLPKGSNVHALRHTFASMLFEKGVHVRIVSELLGHSSVQITMNIYIHLIQDQKLKAMEAIDVD